MQILGPFPAPALNVTDERQVGGAGVTVGVAIQNLSGNLLRIQIGSRQEWLPAFRMDRYSMTSDSTIEITNVLVEIPNAIENFYLITLATTNDAPDGDYLTAFPGTYPNDIGREVAISNLPAVLATDVSDRAGRQLGIIASITNAVAVTIAAAIDITDRAGRLLGVTDVSDRAGRLLGAISGVVAVTNFPALTDISDRMARLLGAVNQQQINGVTVYGPNLLPPQMAGPITTGWTGEAGNITFLANGQAEIIATANGGCNLVADITSAPNDFSLVPVIPQQVIHLQATVLALDSANGAGIGVRFLNATGVSFGNTGSGFSGTPVGVWVILSFDFTVPPGCYFIQPFIQIPGGFIGHRNDLSDYVVRVIGALPDNKQRGPIDSQRRTYSCSTFAFNPAVGPTDIFQLAGSATGTIRVRKIIVQGKATAQAMVEVRIIKRSSLNTAGGNAVVEVPHDSNDLASGASPLQYNANPAGLGVAVGILRQVQLLFGSTAAPFNTLDPAGIITFADGPSKELVLRSSTEAVAINLAGAGMPAGTVLYVTAEYTKD